MSLNEEHLSSWFVNRYIADCAQLRPDYVVQLFAEASISELHHVVSVITDFRLTAALYHSWAAVQLAEFGISNLTFLLGLTVRSTVCWMQS